MAIGLGLHKEFPGWKMQPLKMDTRESMVVSSHFLNIRATITYGLPILWLAGGINEPLLLNIDDRASSQMPCSGLRRH
jgi:transcriptional regulatory protein GAL4